jgi:hypothetical protein
MCRLRLALRVGKIARNVRESANFGSRGAREGRQIVTHPDPAGVGNHAPRKNNARQGRHTRLTCVKLVQANRLKRDRVSGRATC